MMVPCYAPSTAARPDVSGFVIVEVTCCPSAANPAAVAPDQFLSSGIRLYERFPFPLFGSGLSAHLLAVSERE